MNQTAAPHTILRSQGLRVARVAWLALIALMVGLFAAALPLFYEALHMVYPVETVSAGSHSLVYSPYLTHAEVNALQEIGLSLDFYAGFTVAREIVLLFVALAVAGSLFWHKSDDGLALLAAFAFVAALSGSVPEELGTLRPAWAVLTRVVWGPGEAALVVFFFLFPDGRLVPRWIWALPLASYVSAAAWVLAYGTDVSRVPLWLLTALALGVMGSGVFSQVYRYRRSLTAVQRQQVKWVVAGLASFLIAGLVYAAGYWIALPRPGLPRLLLNLVGRTGMSLALALLPLSTAFAVLRYRLWDIDLILNRTLVYTALTAAVAGGYVLLVGGLGALLQAPDSLLLSLLATGLIAVFFQPLRLHLQRGVNRLMYGERDDPYTVLCRLGERLEAALAPGAALAAIVETISQALKLPYAAVSLWHGDRYALVAEACVGVPPVSGEEEAFPLVHQSEIVGQLLLSPRAPGEPFSLADRRLLADVARQAGAVAYAVRLAGDLQRSRVQIVSAREEERRRLRRDLHDGLGPTMASLTLSVDATRNLLTRDPQAADRLLVQLKDQIQTALADIRRIAYDLRPPALDELGLLSALRERSTSYETASGLQITLAAPDLLPPLPAAVEVAAYRIALEALTNVVRHARARRCTVHLSAGDELCLEVHDDGLGLPVPVPAGIGLASMRERAAELGGTFAVESAAGQGTRVLVRLPLKRKELQTP